MRDDARLHDDYQTALTAPLGRRIVVALAVGQALLILLFHEAYMREWPLLGTSITFRTVYLTLAVAVPSALYLLLDDPRDGRPWLLAGGLGAALLPGALFTGAQALPEAHVASDSVFAPYVLVTGVIWFVALAFLQTARRGRRRFDYAVLFHAGWYHLLTLAFAALAVGLFWAVLALWAALFGVVGIEVFGDVFFDRRFAYPATGLAGGLGLMAARTYVGTAAALLRLIMTILTALLPLVATLALVFLAALPFTGLEALWATGRPTVLMLLLVGLAVLFANGAFQDGTRAEAPYPRVVRWLAEAGLAVLPVYAALSAYAVSLRVGQYGWTADRVWAALVVAVLGAFALACALAALWPRGTRWLGFLRRANVALALAVLVALALTQTPLLDPRRLGAADQLARLRSGVLASQAASDSTRRAQALDALRYLRFESGAYGYRRLRDLQSEDVFAARPVLAARLDSVLRDTTRYGFAARGIATAGDSVNADRLRTTLRYVPDTLTVPDAFFDDIRGTFDARRCLMPTSTCALFAADLHGDDRRELVLFRKLTGRSSVNTEVYAQPDSAGGAWHERGELAGFDTENFGAFLDSLEAGRYRLVPPLQRDLQVGPRRLRTEPE